MKNAVNEFDDNLKDMVDELITWSGQVVNGWWCKRRKINTRMISDKQNYFRIVIRISLSPVWHEVIVIATLLSQTDWFVYFHVFLKVWFYVCTTWRHVPDISCGYIQMWQRQQYYVVTAHYRGTCIGICMCTCDGITEDVVEDMMTSWYMGGVGFSHEISFEHGRAIELTRLFT